jgi:hypothetical protein
LPNAFHALEIQYDDLESIDARKHSLRLGARDERIMAIPPQANRYDCLRRSVLTIIGLAYWSKIARSVSRGMSFEIHAYECAALVSFATLHDPIFRLTQLAAEIYVPREDGEVIHHSRREENTLA